MPSAANSHQMDSFLTAPISVQNMSDELNFAIEIKWGKYQRNLLTTVESKKNKLYGSLGDVNAEG